MKVEVVYALPQAVDAVSVSLPAGASLRDAVVASGLLERYAGIRLEKQAFGIFGRRAVQIVPAPFQTPAVASAGVDR